MKQTLLYIAVMLAALPAASQTLTLDSCRTLALNNNRQLAIGRVKKDIAMNMRKSARTKYLPRVTALGGYELMSKEISLLNDAQKTMFNSLGTSISSGAGSFAQNILAPYIADGTISPAAAQKLLQGLQSMGIEQKGNSIGTAITEAFRTDTRQMFAGSVMLTQPIYIGGAITALNRMADIQERLADNGLRQQTHETVYEIDHIYWLAVSLRHKQELAKQFNRLVVQLHDDVQKMVREGVATKADELKVAVKVNESEMALTQAENGVALAKMLLCQQCGLPVESDITLADEDSENIAVVGETSVDTQTAIENRTEAKILENAIDMSKQATNLVRAAFLPQVALTGGYMISNPNVYNGFEKRFSGVWNVGVIFRVPVWNWFEGTYKIRASKAATTIAEYELAEAKEKIALQINQQKFRVSEANKRLAIAEKNIKSAEENLRCATLGFKEGVISSTDVIGAQTAWYRAKSQKIDAEIDVRMSQLSLQKAQGIME
ncbi:MAG: TolC family protein [Bacteroidales bacterium]|nr:TolC family protein [Bacteroidales bacterium]MCM1146425.1 TolC family protein [Bacteroidales bacterium]MCM1205137.1 TolC family protein [Bacillota bacterium]MCM1509384.1 TolC family protein [Clostridium sp.]